MGMKIKIDFSQVLDEVDTRTKRAKENLLKTMLIDTTPFIPIDTGNLRDSGRVTSNGLEWNADYAEEVYTKNIPHIIGTREWFEYSAATNMNKWLKQLEDELNS